MPGAVDLRLELRDVTPAVWRVLRVPSDLRLDDLHHAIQSVMGWDDFHPHVFEVGDEEYGPRLGAGDDDDEEDALREEIMWAGEDSELTVAKAFAKSPAGVTYIYNFAEDWRVHITMERAASDEAADGVVCVAGDNAGPQQESRTDEPFSVDAANRRLARSLRRRATPEFPAGPRATSDQQLLANLTLVVLMLGSRPTRHGTREAWKNVRTEVLESLQEARLVEASPQRKSVTLTDAGVAHAERLLDKLRAL
jgi:hypothetical protein